MRRIPSTLAILAALVLAMAALSPAVTAQGGSGSGGHPLVGVWLVDPTPQDPSDPLELITVAPGGVAIPGGTESGGAAAWSPTGERTADMIILAPGGDPQAGFVGYVTARISLEVSEDGETFSGTYTVEFPAAASEAFGMPAGELGPGEVTGQRVAVEPMGEPVGPLPDFSELFPPPGQGPAPDMSPGVEESPAPEA